MEFQETMSTQESRRVFLAHGRDVSRMIALGRFLEEQGLAVIDPVSEPNAPLQDAAINALSSADIVVADLTGSNPNVFYELGRARALNIPTILRVIHAPCSLCQIYPEWRHVYMKNGLFRERM